MFFKRRRTGIVVFARPRGPPSQSTVGVATSVRARAAEAVRRVPRLSRDSIAAEGWWVLEYAGLYMCGWTVP